MRKLGHSVTTAECVKAAIDAAQKKKFDLVISDIGLPDGSGLNLIGKIQDLYAVKGINRVLSST
jgi:CheY-like chemotaxis protein